MSKVTTGEYFECINTPKQIKKIQKAQCNNSTSDIACFCFIFVGAIKLFGFGPCAFLFCMYKFFRSIFWD